MSHSYTNLLYHVVFATKCREPWLAKSLRPILFAYVGDVTRELGGIALIVNGMDEHIHILAKLRQDRPVSDCLRELKARSSAWIHRMNPELTAFAWQTGYGAFTVSQSQVQTVHDYIKNQETHHRTMRFTDEFRQLLRRNGLKCDEQTFWE
jgi:REP element-mobilizing transposase RayT